jgi:hypothetical protein
VRGIAGSGAQAGKGVIRGDAKLCPASLTFSIMVEIRFLAVLAIARCIVAQDYADYAQYINPFIGTEGAIPGLACEIPSSLNALDSDKAQMAAAMCSLAAQYLSVWSSWGSTPMKSAST